MQTSISRAADQIWEATQKRSLCNPIREIIGAEDIESAYAIQQILTERRIQQGSSIVGAKIGLTSPAVQKQLGVDQPDFGRLFHDMEVWNGGTIDASELTQPKIEAEVAFVLGKDLDTPIINTATVLSAVEFALASLEIVGSRIRDWDIKITDTIADNASASHFVLAHTPVKLKQLDLINGKMSLSKNGELASEGLGASCMGSPINALIWLAQKMQILGTPLKAGDIILSGALGPMVPIQSGDSIVATIEGLGSVSVHIS